VSIDELRLKGFISDCFKMSSYVTYHDVFGYPLGTLSCRQHAQHTDIIHTMHKGGVKSGGSEYAIKLNG